MLSAHPILCLIWIKLHVNVLMLDKNTMMSTTLAMTNALQLIKFGEPTDASVFPDTVGGMQTVEFVLQTLILTQLKQPASVEMLIKSMMPAKMHVKVANLMLYLTMERLDVYAGMDILLIKTINAYKFLLFVSLTKYIIHKQILVTASLDSKELYQELLV